MVMMVVYHVHYRRRLWHQQLWWYHCEWWRCDEDVDRRRIGGLEGAERRLDDAAAVHVVPAAPRARPLYGELVLAFRAHSVRLTAYHCRHMPCQC